MHLQYDECDKEVEDFTSDDMLVDPDSPVRNIDFLQIIHPDSNHTEGTVKSSERTTLLGGSQSTERDRVEKTRLRLDLTTSITFTDRICLLVENLDRYSVGLLGFL